MNDTYIVAGQMTITDLDPSTVDTINSRAENNARCVGRPVAEISTVHHDNGAVTMTLTVGSHYTTGWVEIDDFTGEMDAIITDVTAHGGIFRDGTVIRFGHSASDQVKYSVKTNEQSNNVEVVREHRVLLWEDTTATLPESWVTDAVIPQG